MMDSKMAGRELTCDEWALRLAQGVPHHERPEELLAIALKACEARAEMRERMACADLAREHATTIDERSIAETPYGRHMTEQQRIDVAAAQRHVAQYVGVLIGQRTPPP